MTDHTTDEWNDPELSDTSESDVDMPSLSLMFAGTLLVGVLLYDLWTGAVSTTSIQILWMLTLLAGFREITYRSVAE